MMNISKLLSISIVISMFSVNFCWADVNGIVSSPNQSQIGLSQTPAPTTTSQTFNSETFPPSKIIPPKPLKTNKNATNNPESSTVLPGFENKNGYQPSAMPGPSVGPNENTGASSSY